MLQHMVRIKTIVNNQVDVLPLKTSNMLAKSDLHLDQYFVVILLFQEIMVVF